MISMKFLFGCLKSVHSPCLVSFSFRQIMLLLIMSIRFRVKQVPCHTSYPQRGFLYRSNRTVLIHHRWTQPSKWSTLNSIVQRRLRTCHSPCCISYQLVTSSSNSPIICLPPENQSPRYEVW